MENQYLYGKFEDDNKEKTMSFRVSKETHKLFETHARETYGDVSNGLKEIFLDYMSNHAFRRQSLMGSVRMFIPKYENGEEIKTHRYLPCWESSMGNIPYPSDLLELSNVILNSHLIWDYTKLDLDNWINEESYERDSGFVSKDSDYSIEDGFVVEFHVNNQLDWFRNGVYCVNDEKYKEDDHHRGLIIINHEDIVYYVEFIFEVTPKNIYPVEMLFSRLVTNQEAFEHAMECGNLELAKLIDGFNEGTSNIEHDKQLLLDKRENLLHQIEEIDDKLSKF